MKNYHFYLPFMEDQHIFEQLQIRRSSVLVYIIFCEKELGHTRFLSEQEIKFDRKMQLLDHLNQLYDELYNLDEVIRMFKFCEHWTIMVYNKDHDLINEFHYDRFERDKALKKFLSLNSSNEIYFHSGEFYKSSNCFKLEFVHI